ncbi:MAG: prepilin-type N-terminal cleavage/methylation domain-containing protein [Bacteroidales bacterium]|nr:prepilin-type N-terminal cleavage/methylation domain-containing protein [Bacteroidales bacterium]
MKSYLNVRCRQNHAGFTLVEVMVAAALSVVIMTIISYAFQVGLETTSKLKSIGGLASQIRAAHSIIRSDLRSPHLDYKGTNLAIPANPTIPPTFPVSDLSVATQAWINTTDPGMMGFFRVSGSPPQPTLSEGSAADGYNLNSYRATDHIIHFTIKLSGVSPEDAFAANAPSLSPEPNVVGDPINLAGLAADGQFASHWAEVAYFLAPMGTTTTIVDSSDPPGTTPKQLYTLRRRQRVIADDNLSVALTGLNAANYPELSLVTTPTLAFNTPSTITQLASRLNAGSVPTLDSNTTYRGSDIVLSNVISMRVQLLIAGQLDFKDLGEAPAPSVWDTATGGSAQLRAIRIQLRVYEPKNRLSRQITIDQAL